uniref:beta-xylosidase family glycoside hydrolase n=1 Tax=Paenibacillus sp. FSL R5-0486 TaxID=2921645 RepID=UPI00403F562D
MERYSWSERGNAYMLDDEALPCSRASASGFTGIYLGLRASGNGTENASPTYYEVFYYSNTKGDAL